MPRTRSPARPAAPPAPSPDAPRRGRQRAPVDPAAVAAAYLTGGPRQEARPRVPMPESEEDLPSGGIVDQQVYAPLEAPRTAPRVPQRPRPPRSPDSRSRRRR